MKKNLVKGLIYAVGTIALGLIAINTDWKEVVVHMSSLSLGTGILLLLLQCFTVFILNIQWRSMALRVDKDASFLQILMVNAKGNIIDAITPGVKAGGELARIYELRQRLGLDLIRATAIVGLQKTVSLIAFLCLTLCSLIWFSFTMGAQHRHYFYLFAAVIAIFSILLGILILFSLKPDMVMGMLNRILGRLRLMPKIDRALRDYSKTLTNLLNDGSKFVVQLCFGIFIWVFYAFKLSVVMKGFHIEMDYISIAAITFLSYTIGLIPILPGSIGSFESSMLALLGIKGVPMEVALSIAFVFRFATFWFELIISCAILILGRLFVFSWKGHRDVGIRR